LSGILDNFRSRDGLQTTHCYCTARASLPQFPHPRSHPLSRFDSPVSPMRTIKEQGLPRNESAPQAGLRSYCARAAPNPVIHSGVKVEVEYCPHLILILHRATRLFAPQASCKDSSPPQAITMEG
jgi:hypothetical protein